MTRTLKACDHIKHCLMYFKNRPNSEYSNKNNVWKPSFYGILIKKTNWIKGSSRSNWTRKVCKKFIIRSIVKLFNWFAKYSVLTKKQTF